MVTMACAPSASGTRIHSSKMGFLVEAMPMMRAPRALSSVALDMVSWSPPRTMQGVRFSIRAMGPCLSSPAEKPWA